MTAAAPSDSLPIAILSTAGRLRSLAVLVLQDAGMTPEQFAVYHLLEERGALAPTELARELGLSLEATLEVVRELLERRHLGRSQQSAASRPGRLQLTASGREAGKAGRRGWVRLEAALAENLTDPEAARVALRHLGAAIVDSARREKL